MSEQTPATLNGNNSNGLTAKTAQRPATPQGPVIAALIADLAKFDWDVCCEGCGAPLLDGDDYVSDPDGVSGCWSAMTDAPSKRVRPCYAYRVGKPSAAIAIEAQRAVTTQIGTVRSTKARAESIAKTPSPSSRERK